MKPETAATVWAAAVIAYALTALLTFGYAYNQTTCPQHDHTATLEQAERRGSCLIGRGFGSTLAAFAWPIYWSVEIFEKEED